MQSVQKNVSGFLNCFCYIVCAFLLRHSYLAKIYGFFSFLPKFVFLFVVLRQIPDNDRSQLLPQDV